MSQIYLKNGVFSDDPGEINEFNAVYHLRADGSAEMLPSPAAISAGEGLLMYKGELYVEPLEIQIDFLKAENAEAWLEYVILRHAERVRSVDENLYIAVMMEEA